MATKPEKVEAKAVYTLVIDEDRDNAMNIMYSVLFNNGLVPELLEWVKEEGLLIEYTSMQKEISDKQHELGWCKAPDCHHQDKDSQQGHE